MSTLIDKKFDNSKLKITQFKVETCGYFLKKEHDKGVPLNNQEAFMGKKKEMDPGSKS